VEQVKVKGVSVAIVARGHWQFWQNGELEEPRAIAAEHGCRRYNFH